MARTVAGFVLARHRATCVMMCVRALADGGADTAGATRLIGQRTARGLEDMKTGL